MKRPITFFVGLVPFIIGAISFAATPLTVMPAEPEKAAQAQSARPLPTLQAEMAKGYLPYHQLTIEDFPVNDNVDPESVYRVQPFVHFYYHALLKMAHGGWVYAYVMDWTVFSGIDRNLSSRKSKYHEMSESLPYAQAILDINELYARRLAVLQPGQLPRGDGKTWAEARKKLEKQLDELYQMQLGYVKVEIDALEKATQQGLNKKKVRELSAEVKKRLAATPRPSGPSMAELPSTAETPGPSSAPVIRPSASP